MSFSAFRLKLLDLIDRLFLILEKDSEYVFHLDAQTIVLEDYLEIRPEKESLLKKYVENGNIRVGPWYLQNDFYLTDGESTIRNLQLGVEMAESFGKCGKVGYAPDQFGNISQLPQILKGFGIDNFVFGRGFRIFETVDGVRREKPVPSEFAWIGADGTRVLAIHLKHWYNNAQHIPEEPELAHLLLDINERNFEGRNVSPYILLMNGVDHLEAQDDVREIAAKLRAEGKDIEQTGFDEYIEGVKEAVRGKTLPTFEGALDKGGDYDVLKGCWSSRVYLKQANVRMEDLLENKLEPLYSYLKESGFEGVYPKGEMRYLWKLLLHNHPHDSICGCSRDEVHRHMEDAFSRVEEMGENLVERGLKVVAAHSGHPLCKEENYSVTVFNGTERAQSGVAEAELNFLHSENVEDFAIFDDKGNPLPYEIAAEEEGVLDVFSPLNLPGVLDVKRVRIRFFAKDVPPFSAKIYAVVPHTKGEKLSVPVGGEIENEYYRISAKNGGLSVLDKRTGRVYSDPIALEDGGDKGDSYVYRKPSEKALVFLPVSFETPKVGALSGSLTARFVYDCPAAYDFEKDCRTAETVKNEGEITLTLKAGSDVIELSYRLENRARDHRVRLLFRGLDGSVLKTDSPFDYAEREPFENCDVTDSDTHHNSTFVQLFGEGAFTVYTEGQHETELTEDGLTITLLRATGVINRDATTFRAGGGKCWDVPENQCLREIRGRMGVEYGAEKSGALAWTKGKFFRTGFLCLGDSFDTKKYSGGRFAVQATELEKLYYVKDKYAGCTVSHGGFFRIDSDEIAVTCCKAGEKGGTVVRLVNLSSERVQTAASYCGKIYETAMSEREEKLLGEKAVTLSFTPKQIITLRLDDGCS